MEYHYVSDKDYYFCKSIADEICDETASYFSKKKANGVDTGAKRLFQWLRDKSYLINRKGSDWNSPTQKSMNLGLFVIKESTHTQPDGTVRVTKTTKVTGKGQQYFVNKFLGKA